MTTLEPFSHFSGERSAPLRLLIVGEAWGQSEEIQDGTPFVGASGKELFKVLGEAEVGTSELHEKARRVLWNGDALWLGKREEWLRASGIGITNVFALRPDDNKLDTLCVPKGSGGLESRGPLVRSPKHGYLAPQYAPHLDRLRVEISRAQPNLILALGAIPLWALASGSLSDLRGTVLPPSSGLPKLLPTYHPAAVLRNWSWRSILVADCIKAWKESASAAFSRPQRNVCISPELSDISAWLTSLASSPPKILSCDIETRGGQITSISFGRSRTEALVIPFVTVSDSEFTSYWRSSSDEYSAWRLVQELLATPYPKLFQNGLYDIQWLVRRGLRIRNIAEDTMLMHHAIHPELRKGLGFLGSLYTNEPAWKIMRKRGKDEGEKAEE